MLGKISKKTIIIGAAVFAGLTTLFIAVVVGLVIWLFNVVGSPTIDKAINTTSQVSSELGNKLQLSQFIENGVINTEAVQSKLSELPAQQLPAAIIALRQEANSLVESGQLLQAEADKIINLVP